MKNLLDLLYDLDEIYDALVDDIAKGDLFKKTLSKRYYSLLELESRRCKIVLVGDNILVEQGRVRRYDANPVYSNKGLEGVTISSEVYTPWLNR